MPKEQLKEVNIDEFKKRILSHIKLMQARDTIDINLSIDMARIYNTIELDSLLLTDEIYDNFMQLFISKYIEQVVIKTEATLSKGMCYYSSKYDLYIGGKDHQNSKYILINKSTR